MKLPVLVRSILATVALLCAGIRSTPAQDANGNFLLTENGVTNPQHSLYKGARILKTGGTYYATPPFDATIGKLGEKGTINAPTPFSSGILTNGAVSLDYKQRPMPYAYWSNQQKASLIFDLKKNYRIAKVRVHVTIRPNIHGIDKIGVYTEDEMLEAGSLPMQEIKAQNGWNEFTIGKASDKIKLDFTLLPDRTFMTISEVEILGKPTTEPAKQAAPAQQSIVPKNARAFDFGPPESPVFTGFTAIDQETVYSKARGYGWLPVLDGIAGRESDYSAVSKVVPGLIQRDRGARVKVRDDLFRDFCGAQRAYFSQLEQQFAVDLPNGTYHVYITSGDLFYGVIGDQPMTVSAEGKTMMESMHYGFDLGARTQFEAEVKDGQLNLHFSSSDSSMKGHWSVSGLMVFPVNTPQEKAAAEQNIQRIEKEIDHQRKTAFDTVFTRIERAEPRKLFSLSAAQTQRGYLLFARDWMEMIYPNSVPRQREVENAGLTLACAPGEYEPATLGIYPLKPMEATIEVSDLESASRHKIDKENLSLRITGYLPERMKKDTRTVGDYTYHLPASSWGDTYMEQVPKILRPYAGQFKIAETKQIWLTCHVPSDTQPGQYQGRLTFKPVGHPAQTIPISLTVYPIKLKKSTRVQGMYWSEGKFSGPEQIQNELEDMARHGIRAVIVGSDAIPQLKNQNGKVVVNFSRMDKLIEAIKQAGLDGPLPFLTARSLDHVRDFVRANPDLKFSADDGYKLIVAETLKHAKANDWPQILIYPVDEIGAGEKVRNELKHLGALIRAAAPEAKIYVTVNNYAAGLECAEYIDYQCVNIALSKAQERDILQRGKVYMRYGNSYNFNPRTSRTASGFGFWRIPAVAMYYYHYQFIVGDPLTALDGASRDFVASYPSPDGPLNSTDFEAIREGVDDLNYIATMQDAIAKAKQRNGANPAIKQGEQILQEITDSDPSYNQYDLIGLPNAKYHEWRTRMARVIMQLQK